MAETSIIQVRVNSQLKNDAADLFDSLGLDMTTAIRVFLKKCLQERGIPFEVKNNKEDSLNVCKAFILLRQQAEKNGVSDLSLAEVNEEIKATRNNK